MEPVTPAYVFLATSTPVRLLTENLLIHNLYTLFCVWRGPLRCRIGAFLCDWGTPEGHNTKEFRALV